MIAVPERMKHLDRDHRGYPIPYIVFRDSDNKPHFTINDDTKVCRCQTRRTMRDLWRSLATWPMVRWRTHVSAASEWRVHRPAIAP